MKVVFGPGGLRERIRERVRSVSEAIRRRNEEWEALCLRCGLCCYDKTIDSWGRVINTYTRACQHLDTRTKLCRVYDRRFLVCSECKKVGWYQAVFVTYMPESCAYVRKYRPWRKRS